MAHADMNSSLLFSSAGYSLIVGLAAGSDTLSGQAYGAGNYQMLGKVLQRAVLICWTVCLGELCLDTLWVWGSSG